MKTIFSRQRKSISILPFLIASMLILFSCNHSDSKESSECLNDATKVKVNLRTLSIECPDGQDCLIEYQDKIEIVAHRYLINPESGVLYSDPIYTGMHVPENWEEILDEQSGSRQCNEPPPNTIIGTPGKGKIDFFGMNLSNHDNTFHLVSDDDEPSLLDKIYFMDTCQDQGEDDGRSFLSISIFEGNFNDLSTYYQGLNYPADGIQGSVVVSVKATGPKYFTIATQLGHFVTVAESGSPGHVIRIGHKTMARFNQSVELIE